MLRRTPASLMPHRLFATQKRTTPDTVLPHIKASLFPRMEKTFQARFYANLNHEFYFNPYVTTMLKHIDSLIATKHCHIKYMSTAKMDLMNYHTIGAIAFYAHHNQTIVMPSSPYFKIRNTNPAPTGRKHEFYRNIEMQYLCMFLHEANHAHDFIVSNFSLPRHDATALLANKHQPQLLPHLGMYKMDMALGIRYSNPVMNHFKEAIRKDLIALDDIAGNRHHPQHAVVINFYDKLQQSLHPYPVTALLAELKSRFIEFSTQGLMGEKQLQNLLPATSHWYLNEHLPTCERELSSCTQSHLRRGRKL